MADAEMAEVQAEPIAEVAAEVEVAPAAVAAQPVKLGYAEFPNATAAKDFFKLLLQSWAKNVDLNEYEHLALLDLVKHHPDYERKMGVGARAFQVRQWGDGDAVKSKPHGGRETKEEEMRAFHVVRKDGTAEDFSYIKCLATVYPGQFIHGEGRKRHSDGGHGSRDGHGGRDGQRNVRGKGGRGGGRGRGRGRH